MNRWDTRRVELTDQLAVVSGATGGIGRAVVAALAHRGIKVVMLGRDIERLRTTRDDLYRQLPPDASLHIREVDINDTASVNPVIAEVIRSLGPVQILVHAAGDGPPAPVLETSLEAWRTTIEVKLLGAVRLLQAVGPAMTQAKSGSVILVNGAFRVQPDPMFPINSAVNAALGALAKATSQDLGRSGVRVNLVDPGVTNTALWWQTVEELEARTGTSGDTITKAVLDTIPLGVIPEPRDIAEAVAFLAGPAARLINGAVITVDGGASRSL
ncbi:MAG: AerF [Frankiales bacterium]|nr:AerF [Frankiales bacterium]